MANMIWKAVACPVLIALSALLLPNVGYGAWYQPILVGLCAAAAGRLMELLILRPGTLWLSTAADFAVSFLIVYTLSNAFIGAAVTVTGALLTALMLTATEPVIHYFILETIPIRGQNPPKSKS
ncbi:DUF2512 family protein [Paenibacillus turpanensis]|uniref:DUF2512 family protein n=1 Tax=Paenibacillus turpanensis TaxID=2689078 RepID=UPI00140DE31B|nr:DUF2512 family protein [Paenibacillus turpanensis]